VEPKKTPLYQRHVDLGGHMVPFAGYAMAVQFSGIVDEHLSVRSGVGIFDVSHMGEISVSGDGALEYVNRLTTNDASKIDLCQAQYTAMLNDDGGVIDDLVVYRRKYDYLMVVNAANVPRDIAWVTEHAPANVHIENQSDDTGQIALQGPKAIGIMREVCDDGENVAKLGYFRSMGVCIGNALCLVSRTGYTGEDGFEIYTEAGKTAGVWDTLMNQIPSPKPCGLGARDTLRLEMAFRLHGSDMDETTTPLEAGLGWIVKIEKGDFFGREALVRRMQAGIPRKLIGLKSQAKRFPRHGSKVLVGDRPVGVVTSGGFSPSLGSGIALAYVDSDRAKRDLDFKIDVRGQLIDATYVKGPFYKKPKPE
jgi:aminomethyltransferase